MAPTATAIPATVEKAYKTYCNSQDKIGEDKISLEAFAEKFAGVRIAKEVENQVEVGPEQLVALTEAGWSIVEYTPKGKGSFGGVKGEYLKNDAANVMGAGFLRLNKERLANTRDRLLKNVEAINMVLGDQ